MHPQDASPHSRPPSSDRPWSAESDAQGPRLKTASLANITVPSFATFRAHTSSVPSSSPVRRKPLPPDASPVAARFSSAEYAASPRVVYTAHNPRSFSTDATPRPRTRLGSVPSQLAATREELGPRSFDDSTPTPTSSAPPDPHLAAREPTVALDEVEEDRIPEPPARSPARPKLDHSASSYHTARVSASDQEPDGYAEAYPPHLHPRTPTMSSYGSGRTPNLTLQLDGEDGVTGDFFSDYDQTSPDSAALAQPKSPGGGKLTSFFGWNSAKALGAESPTTTFSDKSFSPATSPAMRNKPSGLDIPKANGDAYFSVPGTPLYSSSPHMNAHVEQLERELREVSTELAGSIRREMELEDEIEHWKSEVPAGASDGRRTSDYYSDSGASSGRYPIGDSEMRIEALEKLRRKVEQEKAQAKVDTAQRLQEELRRRADLEAQVHSLQEQLQDQGQAQNDSDRMAELEATVEDARRRVADERLSKENFQDLLTALRQEHKQDRMERDNLRDEVIPSLQSRLEGLEAEATNTQTLAYEHTRMQQELHMLRAEQMEGAEEEAAQVQNLTKELARLQQEVQGLRNENQTLVNARRMQLELQQQQPPRFSSIQEEDGIAPIGSPKIGLSRSNSLARNSVQVLKRASRGSSLSRSNSVKDKPVSEARDIISDRTKDVEDQRDALHRALKNLVIRHDVMAKQHMKKVHLLEMERDRVIHATPRRTGFHAEVSNLRDEINDLRRRAEDALDQKFQCEKNLGGLRMDLGRAEQETTSLRDLLQERDIFVSERRLSSGSIQDEDPAAPVSLEKAYKELQTTHALSLAHMIGAETDHDDVIMSLLKQSISDAENEREQAIREAENYREQARALDVDQFPNSQASEFYASATRMDELVTQVQQQLHSNMALKQRLAEAIGRGEREQQMSAMRITEMQSKLRAAEDQVMAAQHHSENVIMKHEDEVRDMEESQSVQLQRMKSGLLLSPGTVKMSQSSTALSPMFASRSPKLDKTTSGLGMSMTEASRKEYLQEKVHGLERALNDADREMEEVVSRMNMAQIEVANLQAERDEAMRETQRLQAEILAERESVKALIA